MESASRLNKGSPPIEGWLLMNPVTDGCCGNTGCHNRCVKNTESDGTISNWAKVKGKSPAWRFR